MENLGELKKEYLKVQGKYALPSFEELNRDFKIEKLFEIETDFLIREVRAFISENIDNFLRFVEALLNPVNVPMFLFPIIKSFGSKEKEKLKDIHKRLSYLEVDLMKLIVYSEEKEAEFIKKGYNLWQEIKVEFVDIINVIDKKLYNEPDKENNGYLG